jgi:DNA polymerase phi
MIFQKMIHGAAAKASCLVPSLFSKNFMVCLMNQAAKEDRYLHRAALKALKGIEVAVEETPSLLPIVLKGLLGKHGAYNFDQRTNTKTVDKLLQYTTPTTVKAVLKILRLKDPEKTGLDGTKYYQALGGYLFRLSSVPSKPLGADSSSESVTGPAIRALTELAYSNKSVPTNVRDALRTRSTSAFAKLVRRPEDFGHLCNAILSIDADVDQDDEIASALADAKKMLKDLLDPAKETDRTRAPRQALALLYAVGILQFYNQEPDVIDLFEELRECYDKLANRSRGSDEGMPEYLVEILLAMVARPSSLMRQVSHQVFEAFTGFLSEEALKLLTDPLAAEESEKGQQALFATEDEDVMEAEAADADESDEGELDSDVEMVNLKDAGSEGPDSSDEASADEQDEDADGEDKDQEALDALDNALAEVLGSHRLDKDNEADSAEESDMTDSEMLAVDEKLAEIFRQRAKTTSKKKEKKDAKDTVINFKHRVLDLLAIFVRQEAARPRVNTLVFHVLLPLLHLVRTTKTKPLANKACDIIHALPKALKKARSSSGGGGGGGSRQAAAGEAAVGEKDAKALLALLAQLHDEAAGQDSNPSHAYANAVSTASLAVASVLWGDAACRERVAGVYARTQLRWIQGRARIQPGFFLDWVNWCQSKVNNAVEAATAAPTQA